MVVSNQIFKMVHLGAKKNRTKGLLAYNRLGTKPSLKLTGKFDLFPYTGQLPPYLVKKREV